MTERGGPMKMIKKELERTKRCQKEKEVNVVEGRQKNGEVKMIRNALETVSIVMEWK